MILKKNFLQALVGRKNCMQHKCNRKLMGKKGNKYPAHQIAIGKKFLMTRNHPHPPPPQELNGQPLSEERKIAEKVKFARIAHD